MFFGYTLCISKISALSSARIEYRIPIPLVVGSNPSGRAKRKATVRWFFLLRVNEGFEGRVSERLPGAGFPAPPLRPQAGKSLRARQKEKPP